MFVNYLAVLLWTSSWDSISPGFLTEGIHTSSVYVALSCTRCLLWHAGVEHEGKGTMGTLLESLTSVIS